VASHAIFLAENLCASFILWLGLYIISRDLPYTREEPYPGRRPPQLVGYSMVFLSIYLYGIAMEVFAATPGEYLLWQRATWWSIPPCVVCFFWAVVFLAREGQPKDARWIGPSMWATGVFAALISLVIAGGYALDADAVMLLVGVFQPFDTPMRASLYYIYHSFVLVGAFGSVAILHTYLVRAPFDSLEHRQRKLLFIGSLFLIAGTIAVMLLAYLDIPRMPKMLGDYVITLGIAIIGYDIARYSALKQEQVIEADLWFSLIRVNFVMIGSITLYFILSWVYGYAIQPLAVLGFSLVAVITHTPHNWGDALLDRVFLPAWAVNYREQLAHLRQRPLTAPNPGSVLESVEQVFGEMVQAVRANELDELIRSEIKSIFQYNHLGDPDKLAQSRLFRLQLAQDALHDYACRCRVDPDSLTSQQQAEVLRSVLERAITEGFGPDGDLTQPSPEEIQQTILLKKYLEDRSRTEVEQYLHERYHIVITGGAYSRHLKQARDQLAHILLERELAAKAGIP